MSFFSNKKTNTNDTDNTLASTAVEHDTVQSTPEEKEEHPLAEIIRFAIIALIIVIPIRYFVAQPFIVSGASMENTFHSGEYLIVDQLSYYLEEPARGEVVIFRYPRDPSKFFIKRIIGVPGDTVTIEGNVVTISNETHPEGIVLDEPYVKAMQPNTNISERLTENEYFVMGDNRDASSDSRTWGILTRDKIVGRAFLRLFPVTEASIFPGANEDAAALFDTTAEEVTETNDE